MRQNSVGGAVLSENQSDVGGLVSVRDLVLSRVSERDRWNLALVQRDEVWGQVRMRHLLDSMLAGYPIGAILLCCVESASRVIRIADGARIVQAAESDSWQLLDGQQRINAFFSMLTPKGRYGRFYLHMTMRREPPGPTQARRATDRAIKYISWAAEEAIELDDREMHIDLSRWTAWAEGRNELDQLRVEAENVVELLQEIDPEFLVTLPAEAAEVAADRLRRLIRAWLDPSIPVLRARVADAIDVLEIFTRINLGGVNVESADVYFAAVKTFWPEAEARLDRFNRAAVFLYGRLGALRLVSRLASRGLGQGDLLPLRVDRLAGRQRAPLVGAMQELTDEGSVVLERIRCFAAWLRDNSQLGYGLHWVTGDLWDEVLAWAATSADTRDAWYQSNLMLIDSYLVGGTLFRYPAVMGDRYRRLALLEAVAAGKAVEVFPLERIVSVARVGGLRGSRQQVSGLGTEGERSRIADQHGKLLTSLAQQLPYQPSRKLDWDHIFPQAQASRMWAPGYNGRHLHHRDRHLVNSAGNLWALDAAVNRSLQDKVGAAKFEQLTCWLDKKDPDFPVQPREIWSLSAEDVEAHNKVDRLLNDDPASIDQAMSVFRNVVSLRSTRLLDEALHRFEFAPLFAADSVSTDGGSDPTNETSFHEAMRISAPPRAPATPAAARSTSGELDLGPDWTGRQEWLRGVVKQASKRLQIDQSARALPYKRHGGFDVGRWVKLDGPAEDSYFAIGVVNRWAAQGLTPVWIQINSETGGWEILRARVESSFLAAGMQLETGLAGRDVTRLWLPLEAPAHMGWDELIDHLVAQGRVVRDVITGANSQHRNHAGAGLWGSQVLDSNRRTMSPLLGLRG